MSEGEPATPPVADTPMWLSHHWPGQYDRCVRLGRLHVCRRCLVLYPGAAVAAGLGAVDLLWPRRLDGWLIWLLVVPATLEMCLESLGIIRHSPPRLVALAIPLAAGCGVLYLRYLNDAGDGLTWTVVAVCGGACLLAVVVQALRPSPGRS